MNLPEPPKIQMSLEDENGKDIKPEDLTLDDTEVSLMFLSEGGEWCVSTGRRCGNLPSNRSKNSDEHRIPLSPSALSLLLELKAMSKSLFVFPGGRIGRPVTNPQKWILRIRSRAQLEDFRFHDLRRTAASGMTAIGIPRLTVSKLLNHSEGGITKVYDRNSYDAEKRAALIKWDHHLNRIVVARKSESNVVQLHA